MPLTDSHADLGTLPELNMGFIAPQDLGPLGPGPPPVLVSPVQPSDLLSFREEWLLGGATAWNLQFLGDDSPDVALGDVAEFGDFLLKATRSQPGVPLKLCLHFLLDVLRNLATIGARAGISLPLGWSGQGTVSSSTSPLASIFGFLLPPGEGPDRNLHFLGDRSRS